MAADTTTRMGRPKKAEPTEAVRLPQSFVRKLRRLALHADMDPGDYVAAEFGEALERRHAKMLEEQQKEAEGK